MSDARLVTLILLLPVLVTALLILVALKIQLPEWQNPWTRDWDRYTGQFIDLPAREKYHVTPARRHIALLLAAHITWRWLQ